MRNLSSNMIDSKQLREHVIQPVLKDMGMHSQAAENLLVMIAAHESKMGTYLKQIKGPALGIYQMEPVTAIDIMDNFVKKRPDLYARVQGYMTGMGGGRKHDLVGNLMFQTALARVFFLRFKEPLPDAHDLEGLAAYAKKYWNTCLGKASAEDYLKAYKPHH